LDWQSRVAARFSIVPFVLHRSLFAHPLGSKGGIASPRQ